MKLTEKEHLEFNFPDEVELKFIDVKLEFNLYRIKYSYITIRNNNKENCKYLIASNYNQAKEKFLEWIENYNFYHEYRAISNVKILDIFVIAKFER